LKVGDQIIMDCRYIADAFANHFNSIYNATSAITTYFVPSEFLLTDLISAVEVGKAIKRRQPSQCVGFAGAPSFIIKGCFHAFIRLLTYIFNLGVPSETSQLSWRCCCSIL
jgi:hypothetical protein